MWTLLNSLCLMLGVFFSYCLLVGIVAEFALGNPKRNLKGELRIKKKSFVIEYLFRFNYGKVDTLKPIEYPKNDCQVIRGFFWGIPSNLFSWAIFHIIIGIFGFFGFIFGFVFAESGSGDLYKPYKKYGKNFDKEFVAPWEILLPMAIIRLIYSYWGEIINFVYSVGVRVREVSYSAGTNYTFWKIIALIGLIIFLKNIFFKKGSVGKWVVIKNWLTSTHKGLCSKTELVDE